MGWRVIEEGEIPSLPLGRLKNAFRIQHDFDDELLRHLMQVARQYIENYTQQILGDVRIEITIDRWERSKHPWKGLTGDSNVPVIWIPLPVGPLRTLETVSIRNHDGSWVDVPPAQFIIEGHRLGVRADWPIIPTGIHSILLVGRGGVTRISALVEGVWMNLIRCLYESEVPDISIIQDALKPLNILRSRTLV